MTQGIVQEASPATGRGATVPWLPVVVFVVLAMGLAWLVALPLHSMSQDDPAFPMAFQLLVWGMMFTPTIATLAVMFLPGATPRGARARFLGLWPLRPAKRVVWMSVLALIGPMVIALLTVVVAALFGWLKVDLVGFSGFTEANLAALPEGVDPSILPPPLVLIGTQLLFFPLAALIPNSILGFGEELGWRGFLLPALRPLGVWPSLLLSGAIWGVWHAPVTLLGHNYGLLDWRGVALMTVNCVVWGVLFGWLRLRTGSVWPAVFAHGALNGVGGTVLWFAAAGATIDPALVTIAGAAGWIVVAAIVLVLFFTGQFKREPALAAPRPKQGAVQAPEQVAVPPAN